MQLQDITVLVPTVGRDYLKRALLSIPSECHIIVALDNPLGSSNMRFQGGIFYLNGDPVCKIDQYSVVNFQSPGKTKDYLINKVESEWFMILDDDDYLLPQYLESIVELLNKEDYCKVQWVAPHYCHESKVEKNLNELNAEILYESTSVFYNYLVISKEVFKDYYWEWIDGVRSNDYTLNHIYPTSEILMKTKEYKLLIESNELARFNGHILDDVLPTMLYMYGRPGLLPKWWCIGYSSPQESVSRSRRVHPTKDQELHFLISKLTNLYFESGDDIWLRCLENALRVTNYNLRKYQNE